MKRIGMFVLFLACATSACSAIGAGAGRGPIELSPEVQRGLERYWQLSDASFFEGYFAVSADGRSYGYSYCRELKCRGNPRVTAIRSCQEGSAAPCYLYARGREVVWDTEAEADGAPQGSAGLKR